MARISDEMRLANIEKRYLELKAATLAKEQLKAAKEKERQRKKRARVLIELGSALVATLQAQKTMQVQVWLDLLAKKGVRDEKRRKEAIEWLRAELKLEDPAQAPAQEFQVPEQSDALSSSSGNSPEPPFTK